MRLWTPPRRFGEVLDYAELTSPTPWTTTNTTLWSTAASAKIAELTLVFTAPDGFVRLAARLPLARHSVAAKVVDLYFLINGAGDMVGADDSPVTTVGRSVSVERFYQLTPGTLYTVEVGVASETAGTVTVDVAAAFPAWAVAVQG